MLSLEAASANFAANAFATVKNAVID